MKYYYQILQISPKASSDEIKKAFRTLALQFHPDRVQDSGLKLQAAEKFKEISEAYEVLSDPQKRQSYDEELQIAESRQRYELMRQRQEQLSKHAKQQKDKQRQFVDPQKSNEYINPAKDEKNSNKRTPLHNVIIQCLSISGNSSDLCLLCNSLIDAGVDINAKDEFGKTALYYAVASFNIDIEIIKLLLHRGALPNEQNLDGNTPLHILLSRNFHHSYSDILIAHGANLNLPNKEGKTPFHHVIKFDCDIGFIQLLIQQKANLTLPYFNGKSLLYTAIQLRSTGLIAVLLNHGARLKLNDDTRENFNNMKTSFANDTTLQQLVHRALQLSFPELFINNVVEKRRYVFNIVPPAKKQSTDDNYQSMPNPAVVNGTLYSKENSQQSTDKNETTSANLNAGFENVYVFYRK